MLANLQPLEQLPSSSPLLLPQSTWFGSEGPGEDKDIQPNLSAIPKYANPPLPIERGFPYSRLRQTACLAVPALLLNIGAVVARSILPVRQIVVRSV